MKAAKQVAVGSFRDPKTNQIIQIFRRKNESVKDAIRRVSLKHGIIKPKT